MKNITFLAFILFSVSISAQVGIGTTSPSEALDLETSDATKTGLDINNTGGGDPLIHFQVGGASTFTIGIDNSDSDKLKIGTGALETSTRLTIDASGNVGIGDDAPANLLEVDGSARFNRTGNAVDFQIESDTDPYMFYVDGTNDRIGISSSSPSATLDVNGSAIFNKGNGDYDFDVEGQTDGSLLYVDASADMVGISTSTPTSMLDIQGGMGLKVNTITSATTLDNTHNVVLCNTGAYTVTLPTAASVAGKTYYIKNIDSDSDDITIATTGGQTIDGESSIVLYVYNDAIRVISNGTNWHIIADERIPHVCVLKRNTAQSIANSGSVKVELNESVIDVGGIGDVSTDYRVEVVRSGKYIITAEWTCQSMSDDEYAHVSIDVNGTVEAHTWQWSSSSGNLYNSATVSTIATLNAGEYVEMYVGQTTPAAVNTITNHKDEPRLSVQEIR